MTEEELKFAETHYGDVVLLEPMGRLDQESSQAFQAQLLTLITERAEARANLVLDLGGIKEHRLHRLQSRTQLRTTLRGCVYQVLAQSRSVLRQQGLPGLPQIAEP